MTIGGLLPESPPEWFWEELSAIKCPHWWTPSSRVVVLAEWPTLGSRPPFRPPGYITALPKWSSWQTSGWLRCPQALLLGAPSTKMLMCPLLDRVRCCASSLTCTKAWYQSSFVLMSKVGFFTTSLREGRRNWLGWTHTPTRLNLFSSSASCDGTSRR